MNREDRDDELVDLGAASILTKGAMTPVKDDEEGGWRPTPGLSTD